MVEKNTVLILGAGASAPYGLPLGSELRRDICRWIDRPVSVEEAIALKACGVTIDGMRHFANAFLRSSTHSVDTFLGQQPRFGELGKFAIAGEICRRENPEAIWSFDNTDNWYPHLWSKMIAGVTHPRELGKNRVRILTFNYDRSLEFFLFEAIKHNYNLDDEAALRIVLDFPISHLYGVAGKFHFLRSSESRVYGSTDDSTQIASAARGIKVIPEAKADDETFREARDTLHWAEHVAFMGFGFDATNCKLLGFDSVLDWEESKGLKGRKWIYASVLGCTNAEIATAKRLTCGAREWQSLEKRNLAFLRDTQLLGN